MQNKLLIIEDDPSICELLELFLTGHGFTTFFAKDGCEGLLLFEQEHPNLVLLDLMLPGIDGIQTCRDIRNISNVPIIFISCKKDSLDIIEGLEAGGDDFITKPFIMEELLARIRSNLRRAPIYHQAILQANLKQLAKPALMIGDLKIEENTQRAFIQNKEIALSYKEYRLLLFLVQNPNRIWSATELYSSVWGNDSAGDTRTVNVHISNIRKKIEKDVSNPQYILTIRGGGFMFNANGEA